MRRIVTGEQVARIYNPDPFARPVFRAPVYRTPAALILAARLVRLLIRLIRLAGCSTLKWPHCSPLIWPHRERLRGR
jgi:hypothetical protein